MTSSMDLFAAWRLSPRLLRGWYDGARKVLVSGNHLFGACLVGHHLFNPLHGGGNPAAAGVD